MKYNYTNLVTPKGEARYAYLTKEEEYEGKKLGYSIQVKFSPEDTEHLIAAIDNELAIAKETMELRPGSKWSEDPFLGYKQDKNGDIIFKFKAKSTVKTRAGEELPRTIPVFDAQQNAMSGDRLGNGSTVRVAFTMIPFWVSKAVNGISLRLNAVQVIDFVEYGQKSANGFGFGAVDGGYDSKVNGAVVEEDDVPFDEGSDF